MKKKLLSIFLAVLLCGSLAICAFAADNTGFVYDDAGLLTESEVAALSQKLEQVSKQYNAQIIVHTVDAVDGGDVDLYLEYWYDSNKFGYGENRDGVLLLLCMDTRDYRILSNGYAGDAITSSTIDSIGEAIVSDLSDGEYYDAFEAFAEECAYYLDGYINGFPFDFGKSAIISLIIGVVVSLIVSGVLKGQLKSVRKQHAAGNYVRSGSMNVTTHNDFFLYRTVSRTAKPKNNSSSSGGGSSRSTGGGKF